MIAPVSNVVSQWDLKIGITNRKMGEKLLTRRRDNSRQLHYRQPTPTVVTTQENYKLGFSMQLAESSRVTTSFFLILASHNLHPQQLTTPFNIVGRDLQESFKLLLLADMQPFVYILFATGGLRIWIFFLGQMFHFGDNIAIQRNKPNNILTSACISPFCDYESRTTRKDSNSHKGDTI